MRALLIVIAVAALATAAYGQETFVWFYGVGTGDFMDSPVVFGGAMDPGGDIVDGSWSITVPDEGWPTDPAARYSHIWNTFYAPNYSAGNPSFWTGIARITRLARMTSRRACARLSGRCAWGSG